MFFVPAIGLLLALFPRLRVEGTYHQIRSDFGTQAVAGGPLGYAILWMNAVVIGGFAAAVRAMSAGVPVALASRCPSGAAGPAYAFPGGGATWVRAGALPVGHLCATKARVALAVGIGAGLDRDGLADLLADPVEA